MTIPWGNNRVSLSECVPAVENARRLQDQIDVINLAIESGAVDTFQVYGATGDTTPDFLYEKIEEHGTFDEEAHQLVYAEVVDTSGALTVRLFTNLGGGGGDTYKVILSLSDTPEYLPAKFSGYSDPGSYNSATHFEVSVSPNGASDLRVYAPYNVIKMNSGDGTPGYLIDKMQDTGTYSGASHILVYANNLGSKMRLYTAKSDVTTIVNDIVSATVFGAVRYCKVPYGAVNPATESGGTVTPGTCTGLVELVRDTGTGELEPGATLTNVFYPFPDPWGVQGGRWKIGELLPDKSDPTKLVLQPPTCFSFAEEDE